MLRYTLVKGCRRMLFMKHIRNNIVYPVLMTALLVEQILTSLDRTVSQSSCPVSFLIILIEFVC